MSRWPSRRPCSAPAWVSARQAPERRCGTTARAGFARRCAAKVPRCRLGDPSDRLDWGPGVPSPREWSRRSTPTRAAPLVQVGGHLFWIDQGGGSADGAFWPRTIEELNLATGKSTDIGPGEFAFLSADGRRVYISRTDTTLAELPAGARRPVHAADAAGRLVPAGRFGIAVANGIVVQSNDAQSPAHPPDLAVWNPRTGRVTVIGRASRRRGPQGAAIGAYARPGAGYSLLAWMPASCPVSLPCPITITNTATLASRTLRSPLRYGFVARRRILPRRQATGRLRQRPVPGAGGGTAELALADTTTGALRVVTPARFRVGEDIGWARWLPRRKAAHHHRHRRPVLVSARTLWAGSLTRPPGRPER